MHSTVLTTEGKIKPKKNGFLLHGFGYILLFAANEYI